MQQPREFLLVKFPRSFVLRNRERSLGQQGHGTGAFAGKPLQEREVVSLADTQNPGDQSTVAPFGQYAAEEWHAVPVWKSLPTQR